MIILNYRPDIKTGQENMLALLFDMNKLWEEYVYRMLKRCETKEIRVRGQESKRFWKNKTIRPDSVVEYTSQGKPQTYIIDTKWKIIDTNEPSDADLKQMFVYNMYWSAGKSILLYPRNNKQQNVYGTYAEFKDSAQENSCQLAFADVLKAGRLNMEIGKEILVLMGFEG
ncbi:MAG: 5-methylcytosine restriction system specificity protein McrC [Bacteroidota bacterium]